MEEFNPAELESQELPQAAGDVEESVDAAPAEAASPEGAGTQEPDYRKLAQEWEQRFKGLQARVQREVELRRALELEKMQLEEQLQRLLIEQQLAGLPPEEREARLQQFQYEWQVRQEQQRIMQERAALDQVAKTIVVNLLSQKYGVPQEQLLRFDDPWAMEAFAQEVAKIRRQSRREARASGAQDRFEGAVAASPAVKEPDSLDEAVELLKRRFRGR